MAEYVSSDTIYINKGDVVLLKRLGVPCGINLDDCSMACPEHGAFIGYKIGLTSSFDYNAIIPCIIKLAIPEDAKRSSATSNKCRCDKAKVLDITTLGGRKVNVALSRYNNSFIYEVNKEVSVPDFDENRWHECASGIHFFMTEEEAVSYIDIMRGIQ